LSIILRRFEEVHVRNQNDNERYLAKRRSSGNKREEFFVGNDDDGSRVNK
jgi:hypothetical protein